LFCKPRRLRWFRDAAGSDFAPLFLAGNAHQFLKEVVTLAAPDTPGKVMAHTGFLCPTFFFPKESGRFSLSCFFFPKESFLTG